LEAVFVGGVVGVGDTVRAVHVWGRIEAGEAWGRNAGGVSGSAESDPTGKHNQKIPAQHSAEKT